MMKNNVHNIQDALRVSPAVTRLTVYRRCQVGSKTETEADGILGEKSEDSSKFDNSFCIWGFLRP